MLHICCISTATSWSKNAADVRTISIYVKTFQTIYCVTGTLLYLGTVISNLIKPEHIRGSSFVWHTMKCKLYIAYPCERAELGCGLLPTEDASVVPVDGIYIFDRRLAVKCYNTTVQYVQVPPKAWIPPRKAAKFDTPYTLKSAEQALGTWWFFRWSPCSPAKHRGYQTDAIRIWVLLLMWKHTEWQHRLQWWIAQYVPQ